jgi:phosphatidylserine/phosphatidylglycerophosphate/cardiolipin synthase-like enzyme
MAKRICFSFLLCVILIISACSTFSTSTTSGASSVQSTDEAAVGDWYSVYFSDPNSPTATTFHGGPDSALADAIGKAHLSVDAAIYHLNLWSIRDAMIAAHEAGVKVRVVVESDNMDEVEVQDLLNAGIEILGDRRESLMHNKFVVIDGIEVWTGSMNFTINGAYHNDNNLIRFRSTQLAENFTSEFEEMFVRDMFGDNVVANTPHPVLSIGGTQIETLFSPDDDTLSRIVELIQSAKNSIYFMAYSFTSDEIAEAMLARAEKGVVVTGVFEEGQYYSNSGTEFDRLVEAGLDVRLDGNSHNMHHKVIIIDSAIVILGSYNFSRNAEEHNDENTLIIHNTNIAAQYIAEFQRVLAEAHSR